MLIHVHKVIHKVVGPFARVLRGKEARQDSAKKQRQNRSLEVTGRWPRGHLRVRSVQAKARTKELCERTLAREHLRVRLVSAEERMLRTKLWLNTIQRPVTLTWRCAVRSGRTGRCPTSSHGAPDASDRETEALGSLCCAPDTEAWCVRCGTVLRPVIFLTIGARIDRWRSAAEVECARTHGRWWCTGRWLLVSGGMHQRIRWCWVKPHLKHNCSILCGGL
jgi:hypothetical protein